MPPYKLEYFDNKGLGEPIRMMLTYMGIEFEDKMTCVENWLPRKDKSLFGKLPELDIDGKLVYGKTAICRYLAIEAGLNGKSDWENLQIDMVVDSIMDLYADFLTYFHEKDLTRKKKILDKFINETIPINYDRYENRIGRDGFIANNRFSWADIFFVAAIESTELCAKVDTLEKYENLKNHKKRIYNIPGIKKWIDKRPYTTF